MKPFRLAAPLCLIAAPALAGSLSQPATDPVAVTPLFVPAPVGEWTGFYLGGQVGYGDGGVPGTDYDGGLAGVHAGYLHDLGDWVVGGELDYDFANMSGGPGKIDAIGRAKLIGSYDLGRTLVYATGDADCGAEHEHHHKEPAQNAIAHHIRSILPASVSCSCRLNRATRLFGSF